MMIATCSGTLGFFFTGLSSPFFRPSDSCAVTAGPTRASRRRESFGVELSWRMGAQEPNTGAGVHSSPRTRRKSSRLLGLRAGGGEAAPLRRQPEQELDARRSGPREL